MKLKVLGTQSPYNTSGHNCPVFLITDDKTKIMLDCGSGSHSLLHSLLICESSLLTSYKFPEINSHLTTRQDGIIANEANVHGLMLTHFWPEELPEKYVEEAKSIFPRTLAAQEGKIIDLSKIQEKGESIR